MLDSGQRKLYSTTLFGLQYNNDLSFCVAPEAGRTPEYYNPPNNPTELATWFKIGQIVEESSDEKLRDLMYAVTPHDDVMLATPADFENRLMGGIEHLLSFGNVTYWVGTKASHNAQAARDRIDARIVQAIAPRELIRCESNRILHISDLHLAPKRHAFRTDGGTHHEPTLAMAVFETLKHERLPGLVVVTGDLTWSGSKEEFELAFECLDAIRSTLGLQRQHFVIVPGNHDLQWTPLQAGEKEYDFDGTVAVSSEAAQRNYRDFFSRWYGVNANQFLSIGRRYFLLGGPTVDVLGLNSVALQQMEGKFAGIGRVTETAFVDSAAALGWRDQVRATELRLVAVHHHLLPVVGKERPKDARSGFGIALDAGHQIEQCLRFGVDLTLHGHQHQPFAGYVNREELDGNQIGNVSGLLILGGGSAGVADEHLGPMKRRTFNVIHVERERFLVEMFVASSGDDHFKQSETRVNANYGTAWRRQA